MIKIEFKDRDGKHHEAELRNLPNEFTIKEAIEIQELAEEVDECISRKYKGSKEEREVQKMEDDGTILGNYSKIVSILTGMSIEMIYQMPPETVVQLASEVKTEDYEKKNIDRFEWLNCTKAEYQAILDEYSATPIYHILKRRKLRQKANKCIVVYRLKPEFGSYDFGVFVEGQTVKKNIAEAMKKTNSYLKSLPRIIAILAKTDGDGRYGETDDDRREEIFQDLDFETGVLVADFFLRSREVFMNCIDLPSKEALEASLSRQQNGTT